LILAVRRQAIMTDQIEVCGKSLKPCWVPMGGMTALKT
jgi:hypothetical protein